MQAQPFVALPATYLSFYLLLIKYAIPSCNGDSASHGPYSLLSPDRPLSDFQPTPEYPSSPHLHPAFHTAQLLVARIHGEKVSWLQSRKS